MAIFIKLTARVICSDTSEGSWWIDREIVRGFVIKTKKNLEIETRIAKCDALLAAIDAVIENEDPDLEFEIANEFLGIQVSGVSSDDAVIYRQFIQEVWES